MGLVGAAFGLGFIFGPALGGLLCRISYSTPALAASIVSFITILMTSLFLKETIDVKKQINKIKNKFNWKNFEKILKKSPINLLIIVFFIVNLAFSSYQGIFALYSEKKFNFGPDKNGVIFAYIGILVVLVQLFIMPFFVKKLKEKKVMSIGLFLMFISLFLISFAKNVFFLIITMTLLPFGNGFFNPTIQALASENISKEEYGETLGLMQAFGSVGRILGPI
ncbi:MAG: MFS transporter, partial [Patescibacteria group bacterium]|nr:MFS transporter [Patescibacteria group bacterium]